MPYRIKIGDGRITIGDFPTHAKALAHAEKLPSNPGWEIDRIPPKSVEFTDRERDTIMAALRLWQTYQEGTVHLDDVDRGIVINDISTNGGNSAALSAAETDALVERINGER